MKSILTLAALTGALATAPVFTIGQEPDAALFARAKAILDKAPLIDSHNGRRCCSNGTAATSRGST